MKSPSPGSISLHVRYRGRKGRGSNDRKVTKAGSLGIAKKRVDAKEGDGLHTEKKMISVVLLLNTYGRKGIVHGKYERTDRIQNIYMNCLMCLY